MIFLVFVPFLVRTISALCLPDPPFCNQNHQSEFDQNKAYLKNGHYHQLPYKNPGYVEAFYGANPDIGEGGNIPEQWRRLMQDSNLEGPQNYDGYSEFMSGVPRTYEYNNEYNRKGEKYIQQKVSESTELVDDQSKDQQQGGSVNCRPSAGLYTNYFYGSDNSDLYGLALPHIYTSKYLKNLKSLRDHGFLRDVKLRKYIEHDKEEKNRMRKEMERLRGVYGSKWEQLQNVYTPRYLAYLESLYQPNFLKNIDIYDQSQKLAMFQNFNRNKYWRTLLAPEYSPHGVIQHIISFLHNLRNRHPTSFLQYFHPNEYFQWVPYSWTHGHQQVPVGQHFTTEPFVGNRFDGNDEKHIIGPVTENKNKTPNVDIRFDDGKVEIATTADKKDENGNKNTDSKIIKVDDDQKGSQVEKIEGSSVSNGGIGIEVTGGTNPLGVVETNTDGNNSNKAGSTQTTKHIESVQILEIKPQGASSSYLEGSSDTSKYETEAADHDKYDKGDIGGSQVYQSTQQGTIHQNYSDQDDGVVEGNEGTNKIKLITEQSGSGENNDGSNYQPTRHTNSHQIFSKGSTGFEVDEAKNGGRKHGVVKQGYRYIKKRIHHHNPINHGSTVKNWHNRVLHKYIVNGKEVENMDLGKSTQGDIVSGKNSSWEEDKIVHKNTTDISDVNGTKNDRWNEVKDQEKNTTDVKSSENDSWEKVKIEEKNTTVGSDVKDGENGSLKEVEIIEKNGTNGSNVKGDGNDSRNEVKIVEEKPKDVGKDGSWKDVEILGKNTTDASAIIGSGNGGWEEVKVVEEKTIDEGDMKTGGNDNTKKVGIVEKNTTFGNDLKGRENNNSWNEVKVVEKKTTEQSGMKGDENGSWEEVIVIEEKLDDKDIDKINPGSHITDAGGSSKSIIVDSSNQIERRRDEASSLPIGGFNGNSVNGYDNLNQGKDLQHSKYKIVRTTTKTSQGGLNNNVGFNEGSQMFTTGGDLSLQGRRGGQFTFSTGGGGTSGGFSFTSSGGSNQVPNFPTSNMFTTGGGLNLVGEHVTAGGSSSQGFTTGSNTLGQVVVTQGGLNPGGGKIGGVSDVFGSTAQTVEISGVPPVKSITSESKTTEAEANIGVKANTLMSKVVNEFDKVVSAVNEVKVV